VGLCVPRGNAREDGRLLLAVTGGRIRLPEEEEEFIQNQTREEEEEEESFNLS